MRHGKEAELSGRVRCGAKAFRVLTARDGRYRRPDTTQTSKCVLTASCLLIGMQALVIVPACKLLSLQTSANTVSESCCAVAIFTRCAKA